MESEEPPKASTRPFRNQPSRFSVAACCLTCNAHHSLKSPACSCVFNHVARFIVNANHSIRACG